MDSARPSPSGPARPDLRVLSQRVYRGPNVWSYEQAIHLVVDLGILEEYPTDLLPGFTERLVELLPGLQRHTCSIGTPGGFVQRMQDGTWLGHVAEHVALQLQLEALEGGRLRRLAQDRRALGREAVQQREQDCYEAELKSVLDHGKISLRRAS